MLIKQAAILPGFRNFIGRMRTGVSNGMGRVRNFGTNTANAVKGGVNQFKSELKQFKTDADKYSTKEKFQMLGNMYKDMPSEIASGIRTLGTNFGNAAMGAAKNTGQFLSNMGTRMVNATGRGLQGIGQGFTNFGTRLQGFGQSRG